MARRANIGFFVMVFMAAVLISGAALAADPIKIGLVGIMTGVECPEW